MRSWHAKLEPSSISGLAIVRRHCFNCLGRVNATAPRPQGASSPYAHPSIYLRCHVSSRDA